MPKPIIVDLATGERRQIHNNEVLEAYVLENNVINITNSNALTITKGQVVYSFGNNEVDLSQANSSLTADFIGLIINDSILPSESGYIQESGFFESSDWTNVIGSTNLTQGQIYFLSNINPGQLITDISGLSSGDYIKEIGIAINTTTLKITNKERILLS